MAGEGAVVGFGGIEHVVAPGSRVTFGRDRSCHIVVDAEDRGISRIAGSVEEAHGQWWIVNRSTKKPLHLVDGSNLAIPLPVTAPGWPVSRRELIGDQLTVLVNGSHTDHAIHVVVPNSPKGTSIHATDPASTFHDLPHLTAARRQALVAIASGYLRPYPDYSPTPLTYQQAASLLKIRADQVRKRIEHIRGELTDRGVLDLGNRQDAPRRLCEWYLSMRLLTRADLRAIERPPRKV